jgi:hypothetical protein
LEMEYSEPVAASGALGVPQLGQVPHGERMLPQAPAGAAAHVEGQQRSSVAGRPNRAPLSVPHSSPAPQLALLVQPKGGLGKGVAVMPAVIPTTCGMLRKRRFVAPWTFNAQVPLVGVANSYTLLPSGTGTEDCRVPVGS